MENSILELLEKSAINHYDYSKITELSFIELKECLIELYAKGNYHACNEHLFDLLDKAKTEKELRDYLYFVSQPFIKEKEVYTLPEKVLNNTDWNFDIWKAVPKFYKKPSLKKSIKDFNWNHLSKDTNKISNLICTKDKLANEAMQGIHYTNKGIEATDGILLLYHRVEHNEPLGTYRTSSTMSRTKASETKINHVFPNVGYLLNKIECDNSLYLDSVNFSTFINVMLKSNLANSVTNIIVVKIGNEYIGFNAKFFQRIIHAMNYVGIQEFNLLYKPDDKHFVLTDKNDNIRNSNQLIKKDYSFGIIMKVMLGSSICNQDSNFLYYDMNDNVARTNLK